MTIKIEKKIVGQQVSKSATPANDDIASGAGLETVQPTIETINEAMERPEFLLGSTYKLKPATSDHALYITINDVLLNEGTENEVRRPFEIFINSKAMEHYQWIIALTLVLSATFRKGGDLSFLVDELISVYDPNGGYYKKGGVFMPSLVADIGSVIKRHFQIIGLVEGDELDEHQKKFIAQKRAQMEISNTSTDDQSDFPANATLCPKCHTKAVVIMDGCGCCLSCGDSRCS